MRVELRLPEPPSANRYYRNFRGRTVRSATAKAYIALVRLTAAARWAAVPFPTEALRVTYHWHRSKRMGDLGNREKVISDALNGVLWADDKQIVELHLYRHESPRAGKLELIVEDVNG